MAKFDVFNGDADGICALQQLRLAEPAESELVTGIKRDIQLVKKVKAKVGDEVLVLDISLAKNTEAVNALLDKGCRIKYFDHHLPGDIPDHPLLKTTINISPEICTSLLVNEKLGGQHVLWALVGAYGDNMTAVADRLASIEGLSEDQKRQLQELGICLNYNGYGAALDDLHFKPDDLYQLVKPYKNPFDFISNEPAFQILKSGYQNDMQQASLLEPIESTYQTAVYVMTNEPWCRRVSGLLGNDLANKYPARAHVILTEIENDAYQVSVRAPQNNKVGAGDLCSQFETGGGRAGAAGINHLPYAEKERFLSAFKHQYSV